MVVTNKRQKMASNSNDGIHDLPVTLFASISEYLALPSRILFAVAMTPSYNNSGLLSTYILASSGNNDGASLDTLDFSTVEKDICEKLTDGDIYAALLCINAQRALKKLILTGCTSITGTGLEPLRRSSVLEMIDLSLVGKFQNPKSIEGKTALSEEIVIPILQSIVDTEGCSLRHVNLHETWRSFYDSTEDNQLIRHFVESYSNHLNRSSHRCSGEDCDNNVVVHGTSCGWHNVGQREPWFYGHTQSYTCNQCGVMFCDECENSDGLGWCNFCLRAYCKSCVPSTWCQNRPCKSGGTACSGCLQSSLCRVCDFECCTDCNIVSYKKKGRKVARVTTHRLRSCDECGESICREGCNEYEDFRSCTNCKRMLCNSCCDMTCCVEYGKLCCFGAMCHDCHPKDWKCMWCDEDEDIFAYSSFFYSPPKGQRCADCYVDSTTRCSKCRMKKLFDEEYKSPSIPKSYWVNLGFDEVYAKEMEEFLSRMKIITLQLMSGDRLRYGESFSIRYRREEVVLQHDDILLPHWLEFIYALRQYNHEPTKNSDRILYVHNVRLSSFVMDMLAPALQVKGFTLELEDTDEQE